MDYAARVANELGADVVKLSVPKFKDPGNADSPAPYGNLYEEWRDLDEDEAFRLAVEEVITSAGRTMVLFSGGSRISDGKLLQKARICRARGATGLIFGRNMWQRYFQEGLEITKKDQGYPGSRRGRVEKSLVRRRVNPWLGSQRG